MVQSTDNAFKKWYICKNCSSLTRRPDIEVGLPNKVYGSSSHLDYGHRTTAVYIVPDARCSCPKCKTTNGLRNLYGFVTGNVIKQFILNTIKIAIPQLLLVLVFNLFHLHNFFYYELLVILCAWLVIRTGWFIVRFKDYTFRELCFWMNELDSESLKGFSSFIHDVVSDEGLAPKQKYAALEKFTRIHNAEYLKAAKVEVLKTTTQEQDMPIETATLLPFTGYSKDAFAAVYNSILRDYTCIDLQTLKYVCRYHAEIETDTFYFKPKSREIVSDYNLSQKGSEVLTGKIALAKVLYAGTGIEITDREFFSQYLGRLLVALENLGVHEKKLATQYIMENQEHLKSGGGR